MAAVAERPPRSGQRPRHGQESRAKRAAHTGATLPPPRLPQSGPPAMPVGDARGRGALRGSPGSADTDLFASHPERGGFTPCGLV